MDIASSNRRVFNDWWRLACRHLVPRKYINLDRNILPVHEDV